MSPLRISNTKGGDKLLCVVVATLMHVHACAPMKEVALDMFGPSAVSICCYFLLLLWWQRHGLHAIPTVQSSLWEEVHVQIHEDFQSCCALNEKSRDSIRGSGRLTVRACFGRCPPARSCGGGTHPPASRRWPSCCRPASAPCSQPAAAAAEGTPPLRPAATSAHHLDFRC